VILGRALMWEKPLLCAMTSERSPAPVEVQMRVHLAL